MKHLLFLDIETTGLNPEKAELIELSAIRVSADFTEELEKFDELVRPEEKIPPFITRLTGISDNMVAQARDVSQIREEFKKFLRPSDIICGHNIQFDIGFLREKGFDVPNEGLDTFPLSNVLLPDEPSYSLEVLAKRFQIEHRDAHRALADVQANIDLFLELKKVAENLSQEMQADYREILSKSSWTGNILFDQVFSGKGVTKISEKSLHQLSIFDEEAETFPKKIFSDEESQADCPTLSEQKAGKIITELLNNNEYSILSLPAEVGELSAAVVAAVGKVEPLFIALPQSFSWKTPEGFFRYAAPNRVICSTAFEKWKSKKNSFTETEVIAALKIIREIHRGSSLIYSDLPLFREEWEIAKKWLSDDHIRCSSDCPAKKMSLLSRKQKRFFCDIADVAQCPASHGIILRASQFSKSLDSLSRKSFSLQSVEKWVQSIQDSEKDFSDALLFGIGLLKRYLRERVGESPYRKFFVLHPECFQDSEIQNLKEGFIEGRKRALTLFPENSEIQEQLSQLISFFEEEIQENECRYITLYADNNLLFTRSAISLDPLLSEMLEKKESVVFTGKAILRRAGKYIFGNGLNTPDSQQSLPSHFDYQNKSHVCIPTYGGNTKMSGVDLTVSVTRDLFPHCHKNILVLFPGTGIAEKFCTEITDSAEENDFQVLTLHGSKGKIREQMRGKKTILVATLGNWQKIDFRYAQFIGCIQHRLLFDSPPDPVEQLRNENVTDEFLEIAIPKVIQKFQYLLGGLTAGSHPFFWVNLDAHFQKKGGFTENILSALPEQLPIHRMPVSEINESVTRFLHTLSDDNFS